MLSLILAPSGRDNSTISLHFPSLCFLGIVPSGLRCILDDLTSCLHILPNCTSHCRYSDIIVGYLISILSEHEYNEHLWLSRFKNHLLPPPIDMLHSSGLDDWPTLETKILPEEVDDVVTYPLRSVLQLLVYMYLEPSSV